MLTTSPAKRSVWRLIMKYVAMQTTLVTIHTKPFFSQLEFADFVDMHGPVGSEEWDRTMATEGMKAQVSVSDSGRCRCFTHMGETYCTPSHDDADAS